MIRLRADSARLRRSMRQREAEAVFGTVPDETFDEALEVGAGDGFQSQYLARCAGKVVCTDLNPDRLIHEPHLKITYEVCDVEALPFETGRFNLIYSSNLLEHLPEPERALLEMHRVLRDDGVTVHVVPNRFWKVLHLALFYPSRVVATAEVLLSRERRRTLGKANSFSNNPKRRQPSFVERNVWPPVHGESVNHWAEFVRMGASHWKRLFSEAGFQLIGYIDGLPAHSAYRFGMDAPRKALERMGFSTSNGYVLTKKGHSPETAWLFSAARRRASDPPGS